MSLKYVNLFAFDRLTVMFMMVRIDMGVWVMVIELVV